MAQIHQDAKGYWRFGKGWELKNGKRVQKHHSLGSDHKFAQILANFIDAEWTALSGDNAVKVWTAGALQRAKQNALNAAPKSEPQTTNPTPTPAPKPKALAPAPMQIPAPQPAPNGLTLFKAFEHFKIELEDRVKAKEIGEDHCERTKRRIDEAKRHFEDRPLDLVDHDYLVGLRRKLTARPMRRPSGKKDVPRPVSPATVQGWLMSLSLAFDFFTRKSAPTPDNPKRKLWTPDDIHWRENFTVSREDMRKMATPDERQTINKPKPTYTIAQIKEIFKICTTDRDRMSILMGICFGWTQANIANLRKDEILTQDGEMYIRQDRSKTGVEGFWWVCPELANMIRRAVARTPDRPDKLALLSDEGLPLIHGNTDVLHTRWTHLRTKFPDTIPQYPFARLRKLGGQLMLNRSRSKDFTKLLLTHSRAGDVTDTHYVGPDVRVGADLTMFEMMHQYQRAIYENDLKPLFEKETKKRKAA